MSSSKDKYLKYKKKYLELKSQIGGTQSPPVVSGPQFATEIPERSKGSLENLLKMDWDEAKSYIYHKKSGRKNQVGRLVPFPDIKIEPNTTNTIFLSFWINGDLNEIILGTGMYAQEIPKTEYIQGPKIGLKTDQCSWEAWKNSFTKTSGPPETVFSVIDADNQILNHGTYPFDPDSLEKEYLNLAEIVLGDSVKKGGKHWLSHVIKLKNSKRDEYKHWFTSLLLAIKLKYIYENNLNMEQIGIKKIKEVDFSEKFQQKMNSGVPECDMKKLGWIQGHKKIEMWITSPIINGQIDSHAIALYPTTDKSELYLEIH